MKNIERVALALLDNDWSTICQVATSTELTEKEAREALRHAVRLGYAASARMGRFCIYWIEPAGVAKVVELLERTPEQERLLELGRERKRRYRLRHEQVGIPALRVDAVVLASHLGAVWR